MKRGRKWYGVWFATINRRFIPQFSCTLHPSSTKRLLPRFLFFISFIFFSLSLSSFSLPLPSIFEFFQVEKKSNLLEIEWMNECVCDSLHQFTFSLSQLHSVLLHLNSTDGRLSCVQVWLGAGNICYLWLLPSSPLTHLHISFFPSLSLSLSSSYNTRLDCCTQRCG